MNSGPCSVAIRPNPSKAHATALPFARSPPMRAFEKFVATSIAWIAHAFSGPRRDRPTRRYHEINAPRGPQIRTSPGPHGAIRMSRDGSLTRWSPHSGHRPPRKAALTSASAPRCHVMAASESCPNSFLFLISPSFSVHPTSVIDIQRRPY